MSQLKRLIESDAAMTEDLIAYNIIPLDAPSVTNAIVSLPEVSYFFWVKLKACICAHSNSRKSWLGSSSSFRVKVLQGPTKVAYRFSNSCYTRAWHAWFPALCIWISGIYHLDHSFHWVCMLPLASLGSKFHPSFQIGFCIIFILSIKLL